MVARGRPITWPGRWHAGRFLSTANWIICVEDGHASPLRISNWYLVRRISDASFGLIGPDAWNAYRDILYPYTVGGRPKAV